MTFDFATTRPPATRSVAGTHGVVRQLLAGLALSACFGLAIGARHGLPSMAIHAAGVPLGFATALVLAAPALCIGVAHLDLPVDTLTVVRALASGVGAAGRVLAGLAPAALLLTVTPETHTAAAIFATLGLALGSGLGLRAVVIGLEGSSGGLRLHALLLAFSLLAALLTVRVWWLLLPMLGGPALGAAR